MIASEPVGMEWSARLVATLAQLPLIRSETALSGYLARIATDLFDAAVAKIVTSRSERSFSDHSQWRGRKGYELIRGRAKEIVEAGEPVTLLQSADIIAGANVPVATKSIAIVPCSGPRSDYALLIAWPRIVRRLSPAVAEGFSALARTVGLIADRITFDNQQREHLTEVERRLRNMIGMIRSVAHRSSDTAVSMNEFLLHFEGRCDAIVRSQLPLSSPEPVDLELLIRDELLRQGIQEGPTTTLRGMDIRIDHALAERLSLLVHELAVNAFKYGAFSGASGTLKVVWWVENEGADASFHFTWSEDLTGIGSGSGDAATRHRGFGTTLIEEVLPYELNAACSLDFTDRGLRASMVLPVTLEATARHGAAWEPALRRGNQDRPASGSAG